MTRSSRIVHVMGLVGLVAGLVAVNNRTYAANFSPIVSTGSWSSTSTWNTGTIPQSTDDVYIGATGISGPVSSSTISLAGNSSARYVGLGNGPGASGTLNLSGFTLTTSNLVLGADPMSGATGSGQGVGNITRSGGGSLAIGNTIYVNNGNSFTYGAGDVSSTLSLTNSTAAVSSASNVTTSVLVGSGSTLNLNSNLNLSNTFSVTGTVNANNSNIAAASAIVLNSASNITNRGTLTTGELQVRGRSFTINSTDSIGTYNLINASSTLDSSAKVTGLIVDNSTATTTATGNVTNFLTIKNGGTLNLSAGAALNLSANLDITTGTLNANGNAIRSNATIGLNNSSSTIINRGALTTSNLNLTGSSITLTAADSIGTINANLGSSVTLNAGTQLTSMFNLTNSSTGTVTTASVGGIAVALTSTLTVQGTQTTGLTVTGTRADSLAFYNTNALRLNLDGQVGGWALRWANPTGGNHIADLTSLIAGGQIQISLANGAGYNLSSNADGYTYVNTLQPVPEPGTIMLIASSGLAAVWGVRRRFIKPVVVA